MDNLDYGRNKGLIFIAIVLLCAFIGMLGWYFIFQKGEIKSSSSNKYNVREDYVNKIEDNLEDIELDKVKANEQLEDLNNSLMYANLANDTKLISDDKINNTNLLYSHTKVKIALYYTIVNANDTNKVFARTNYYGQVIDGSYVVLYSYFSECYKSLFNEELNMIDVSILGEDALIENDYLYVSLPIDFSIKHTALKANNLVKKDNLYELEIDCLYFENIDDNNRNYFDSNVVDYDTNLVSYKIKVIYEIIDSKYIMLGIVAY